MWIIIGSLWLVLMAIVALMLALPETASVSDARDALAENDVFSLAGTAVERYDVLGHTLVYHERQGLSLMDALGREQSYIAYPYRQSRVLDAGSGRMVAPAQGAGFFAIAPDHTSWEVASKETVNGAAYGYGRWLTFGPSSLNRTVASVYDPPNEAPTLTVVCPPKTWPVRAAWVTRDTFDLLLLDLSSGEPISRLIRYDREGEPMLDRLYDGTELYAGLAYADGDLMFLYSDRAIVALDRDSGERRAAWTLDTITRVADVAGRLVFSGDVNGQRGLYLTPSSSDETAMSMRPLAHGADVRCFDMSQDGSLLLAATDAHFLIYDIPSGDIIARQPLETAPTRILALSDRVFMVFYDDVGGVVTVR